MVAIVEMATWLWRPSTTTHIGEVVCSLGSSPIQSSFGDNEHDISINELNLATWVDDDAPLFGAWCKDDEFYLVCFLRTQFPEGSAWLYGPHDRRSHD